MGMEATKDASTISQEFKPEWNVIQIGADKLFAQGITGKGWTVANADTGIHYQHEALTKSYRGTEKSGLVKHEYNWWDGIREMHFTRSNKCGYGIKAPCDDNGHGTHTVGTSR
jgi:subtilisin family serine protease